MNRAPQINRSVVIAAYEFPPDLGGTAEMSAALARGLAARGWSVTVITRENGATVPGGQWPFPVHRWLPRDRHGAAGNLIRFLRTVSLSRRLRTLAREKAASYILVTEALRLRGLSGAAMRKGLAAAGARMGVLFHGMDLIQLPAMKREKRWLYRRTLRSFDDLYTNSLFTAECARLELGEERRVTPIGCGVSPEMLPEPVDRDAARRRLGVEGGPVLLTVARLVPRKGVDRTIEALPQIRARFPGVQYLVAGDGPDRSRLEKLTETHGCKDCVQFLGNFSDAEKGTLYSAADVFIMPCRCVPSRSVEGFGIVFLEANHYGVPVVAGCSGGAPDAVAANETGLLVPPEYPDDIARAVLELFEDPERARRMGQRGRERVHGELTWDHVVQRLEGHLLAALPARADAF